MGGFNLPPGCSVHDIPGNRPEDLAAEAFYDAIYEQFPASMADADMEKIADWVWEKVNAAHSDGYAQAQADERMAKECIASDTIPKKD